MSRYCLALEERRGTIKGWYGTVNAHIASRLQIVLRTGRSTRTSLSVVSKAFACGRNSRVRFPSVRSVMGKNNPAMEYIEHFTKGNANPAGYPVLCDTSSRLNVNPRKCIIRRDNLTALRSAHRLAQGEPGKFYESANEARSVSMWHVSFRGSLRLSRAFLETRRETCPLFPRWNSTGAGRVKEWAR